MVWSEVFIVFFVCHLAGDFILQTEWQATRKHGGLGGGEHFRALSAHVATYAIPFVPAFIWVADEQSPVAAIVLAAIVLGTHFVQDDGRLLKAYVLRIKKTRPPFGSPLWICIDQSFHITLLFVAAVAVDAL